MTKEVLKHRLRYILNDEASFSDVDDISYAVYKENDLDGVVDRLVDVCEEVQKERTKEILRILWKEIWNDELADVVVEQLANKYGVELE